MLEAAILAVHSNVKDLRKEFPLATFKTVNALHANGKTEIPVTLVTCCPVGMREVVLKRMQQAADSIQFSSATVDTAGIEADKVQQVASSQQVAAFRAQLEENFGCYISLAVDTAQKAVTITSLKVILPDVERRVRLWLGLPVQAASVLGLGPLKTEQKALQALLVSNSHTSACPLAHAYAHDALWSVIRVSSARLCHAAHMAEIVVLCQVAGSCPKHSGFVLCNAGYLGTSKLSNSAALLCRESLPVKYSQSLAGASWVQ